MSCLRYYIYFDIFSFFHTILIYSCIRVVFIFFCTCHVFVTCFSYFFVSCSRVISSIARSTLSLYHCVCIMLLPICYALTCYIKFIVVNFFIDLVGMALESVVTF